MHQDFLGGSAGKESACDAGDTGSIPGRGRSPGEGSGYPLQCSCLEKPVNGGAWKAAAHRVEKEVDTTEQLTLSPEMHEASNFSMSFPTLVIFHFFW